MEGIKSLKLNRKGFTMFELITVMVIIGILLVVTVPRFSVYIKNNKIDTVESELRTFALDLNNFALDYGAITIVDTNDETEYRTSVMDYLDKLNGVYLGTSLDTTNVQLFKNSGGIYTHFRTSTNYKDDPWGGKYELIFYTRDTVDVSGVEMEVLGSGIVIVKSNGPDGSDSSATYSSGEFQDDIILIVQTK